MQATSIESDTTASQEWARRLSVFVLALAIRLIYLYSVHHNPFFDSPIIDAQTYHEQALRIASGTFLDGRAFWQPPLYPLLLGLLYALIGPDVLWSRIIQMLVGSLSCVLISELAARSFGSMSAWCAGLLGAFYAPLIFFDGELLVPVISIFLNLCALVLIHSATKKPKLPLRNLLIGTIFGFSALARPTIVPFVLLFAYWQIRHRDNISRHVRLLNVCALLASASLPILAVTILNLSQEPDIVLVSSNGGINFFLGNNGNYDGMIGVRPGIAWKHLMNEAQAAGAYSSQASSYYWFQKALDYIASQPLDWLHLTLKKAFLLIQAYEIPRNLDYNYFRDRYAPWIRFLPSFGMMIPLALLGLWRTRHDPTLAVLRLFILTNGCVIIAFFIAARYRLTLIPILLFFAGSGLSILIRDLCRRDSRSIFSSTILMAFTAIIVQQDPFDIEHQDLSECYNLIGKADSNGGRHSEAIKDFSQALQVNSQHWDAMFNLAREYQLMDQCAISISLYKRVLDAYSNDRDSLNNLGICLVVVGDTEAALVQLEKVIRLYPDGPDIYINLSQAYLATGDFQQAMATSRRGLEANPSDANLARVLTQAEAMRTQERNIARIWRIAETTLRGMSSTLTSRTLPPPSLHAKYLNNQGHHLLSIGRINIARQHFLESLAICPTYPTAWSNLAQTYFIQGLFPAASQAFEYAIQLDPRFWRAHMGLALTQARGFGEVLQAREKLEFVIQRAAFKEKEQAKQLLHSLELE